MTKARKMQWLQVEIFSQRKWIEDCEANGVSYTGENGPAIRQADHNALRSYESQLRALQS